jgi:1-deoxy-D-xylulose-5-phosphate synthase
LALPLLQLGLRDEFIEHGDPALLLAAQGLDAAGIEASVRSRFGEMLGQGLTKPGLKSVA